MPDDPIIVSGGATGDSVTISFASGVYSEDSMSTGGDYVGGNKRITRIEVTDDNTNETQTIDAPENGKCTVTIHCE